MTTQKSERERVITKEAKAFSDKMYPCEEPCDSYGVCYQCCEKSNFDCGYNFGYDARDAEVEKLKRPFKKHKTAIRYGLELILRRPDMDEDMRKEAREALQEIGGEE